MKINIPALFIVFSLLISGCGYKPSTSYAKGAIKGKTFVDVILNIQDSTTSIYIKDQINKMVINRFNSTLTNKKELAQSVILINLRSISHTAIETSITGYAKTYRTTVNASVSYKNEKTKFKTISVSDFHDYSIDENSVLSTAKKNEAVKIASMKAIYSLFSKIAVKNIKN